MDSTKLAVFALMAACLMAITGSAQGPHTLEVSAVFHHFSYEEDLTPPLKSTETGWLPGLQCAYNYAGPKIPAFVRFSFNYTKASTDYDGSTQEGIPVQAKTDNIFMEFEGRIGYSFRMDQAATVSLAPYVGLGYHYWKRGGGGDYPYDEIYTWKYVPIGLRAAYLPRPRLQLSLDVAAKIMFGGEILVELSDIDPGLNDPKAGLDNKVGWRFQGEASYQISKRWFALFSPWFEYSAIGKSDVFELNYSGWSWGYGYEPASTTYRYGLNIGLRGIL